MDLHRTAALAAAALALATPIVASTATHAAPPIQTTATGTYADQGWRLLATTTAAGAPLQGTLRGTLKLPFGGWPDAGECVAADPSAWLDGPGAADVWFFGDGELCGLHLDETNAVRYAFTGGYVVVEATPHSLLDSSGWMEMRFAADGRASITLVAD